MPYDKLNKVLTKYVLVSDTEPEFWLKMYESPEEVPVKDAFHGEVWCYDRREDGDFLSHKIIPGSLTYEQYFKQEAIHG